MNAVREIIEGIASWRLWWTLSWFDTRARYRRSVLGPFWLTLSMALTVVMLGAVYGYILKAEQNAYVPHLTMGFVIWTYMATLQIDSCRTFMEAGHIIRQRFIPLTVFVMRVISRNVIVFFHTLLVFVPVALYYKIWPSSVTLLALGGFVLLIFNSIWVGLLTGLLCARYRDIPQLISSLVNMAFFLTPVIWGTKEVGERLPLFLTLNPFYHFMELIRAPLLGAEPRALSWLIAAGISVVGWGVTILFYSLCRKRVVYWI
jgi:lipopolysaccharide transport system permease protein